MGERRCGYCHDVSRLPDVGAVCCWRPTWNGRDRCVWHANVDGKSADALATEPVDTGDRLDGAVLRAASLSNGDRFAGRVLIEADFSRADVRGADFRDADLREVTFEDANAREAAFDRTNLENATMRDADLRGATFVDAKLDEVTITASRIDRTTTFGGVSVYETELFASDDPAIQREKFEAATWTYRMLQRLAEDNARRGQLHSYYYREKDLRRRFSWTAGYYRQAISGELARLTMGYGHSIWRVLLTSGLVVLVWALLYPLTGGVQEADSQLVYNLGDPSTETVGHALLVFFKSLYFSAITFATLGYGDIQPIGGWARALAAIESIVGAVLMALVVVVLYRRVVGFRQ